MDILALVFLYFFGSSILALLIFWVATLNPLALVIIAPIALAAWCTHTGRDII